MKYLYLMVTDDEYELPVIVTDSMAEFEKLTGKTRGTLYKMIRSREWSPYMKIPVEGEYELKKRIPGRALMGSGTYYASVCDAAIARRTSVKVVLGWLENLEDWYYVD